MTVYNTSTRDFSEAYDEQTKTIDSFIGGDSIYEELESAVDDTLEEAREAKKAEEEEALGGGEVETDDEDEDDSSISLVSTFGALAIAATALAF